MSERGEIHQCCLAMGRLQGQREVDGHSGCPTPALGIDHGKYLATRAFFMDPALGRSESNKCLQKIRGGGGTLDELASSGAHCAHNYLRLVQISYGKHGGFGEFLIEKFNRSQGYGQIVTWGSDY